MEGRARRERDRAGEKARGRDDRGPDPKLELLKPELPIGIERRGVADTRAAPAGLKLWVTALVPPIADVVRSLAVLGQRGERVGTWELCRLRARREVAIVRTGAGRPGNAEHVPSLSSLRHATPQPVAYRHHDDVSVAGLFSMTRLCARVESE